MKNYRIGVLAILVLAFGLFIYVLTLGALSRQDAQTQKKENEVGALLNSYVADNDQIPEDLNAAGISDLPDVISYRKLSDSEYELCVTYKAASSGSYTTNGLSSVVLGLVYQRALGVNSDSYSSLYDSSSTGSYKPSSYYAKYTHSKGENCQTIKPYIYSSGSSSNSSSSASSNSSSDTSSDTSSSSPTSTFDDSEYCDPSGSYYSYYGSYCTDGKLDFSKFGATTN